MSYTSSDPENSNRDPDTSSLASTSTAASQLSKSSKKKPWSKLKSGIKSIGRKMSTGSKPTFAEPTESSEQKKVKKSKKFKESGSGGSSEVTASSTEGTREKSPTKGLKSLTKRLSVEAISTPFVGYQPSSVSPTRSYAKAVYKSVSTSESNLSTSDLDTPKKSSTLDRNTELSMESPDSGRVSRSRGESSSRPPSQITEEGYVSNSDPDLAVTASSPRTPSEPLGLVAKTQHFAQTVIPPKQDRDVDVSVEFIKAETLVKPPKSPSTKPKTSGSSRNNQLKPTEKQISPTNPASDVKDGSDKKSLNTGLSKESNLNSEFPAIDEVEGRKKNKRNKKPGNASASFISSEKSENSAPTESQTRPLLVKEEPVAGSSKKNQGNSVDSLNKDTSGATASTKEENIKDTMKNPEKVLDASQKVENVVKSDPASQDKNSLSGDKKKAYSGSKEVKADEQIKAKKNDKVDKSEEVLPSTDTKDNSGKETKKEPHAKKEDNKRTSLKESEQPNNEVTPEGAMSTSALVDDFGPMTPSTSDEKLKTQMSVEEKLEAFLSAEGWSGTIKDVAEKSADADASQQADKRECLYKILVIGELGTGKTSIIKRYVHQFFSQHYRATIGVDFALKVLNWDSNTIIRLQLWDIAGQERFGNMTRVYYKEAVGAFIVFDVTRSATFDAVLKWKQDLDSKVQLADGSPIPCVLLANKCDQQKEGLVNTPSKMDEYCKENNFSAWFETSAKENINIDDAARSLVSQILQNDRMSQNGRDSIKDGSKFPLENKPEDEGRTCSC